MELNCHSVIAIIALVAFAFTFAFANIQVSRASLVFRPSVRRSARLSVCLSLSFGHPTISGGFQSYLLSSFLSLSSSRFEIRFSWLLHFIGMSDLVSNEN